MEESLKKESYDYVASTYYLVLEQQLRQDQMRRHYAQAGHAAQAQARTGSAGDDYDSHPLSPGPGTPGLVCSSEVLLALIFIFSSLFPWCSSSADTVSFFRGVLYFVCTNRASCSCSLWGRAVCEHPERT